MEQRVYTHGCSQTRVHTHRMLLFLFYCQPCSVNDNGYLFNVYLFTDACEQIIESKVESDMPFFSLRKKMLHQPVYVLLSFVLMVWH